MGQFHLQPPLGRRCPLPENLEDQARPVDYLGAGLLLERLLLHRSEGRIDDQQLRLIVAGDLGDLLDLPLPQQCRRSNLPQAERLARDHLDPDRAGEAFGFLKPRLGRAAGALPHFLRDDHDRPLAAGDVVHRIVEGHVLGSSP